MKQKLVSLMIAVSMVLAALLGLTSCNEDPPAAPQKLSAPVITLEGNVASWKADPNADKFEISLDGILSYVENTTTTKDLTNGQTLKVRAVGDGSKYSTSDWSNSVTFTKNTSSPASPVKLAPPTVNISEFGLASWTAVENASGYVYKINGGAETSVSETSVQLTNGQSIAVKAVGDGVNYADSDFSTSKTYTAASSSVSGAPAYIGIYASNNEPSADDGLPGGLIVNHTMMAGSGTRSFDVALNEYFENTDNHFNSAFPTGSDYGVYSSAGETVYVQIWLNNPTQYTILSLKLNGTKYQVGGGLSSFFVEEGGQHYNCIYVAVTIPENIYVEKSYTVTDIEYIADTYINADGTDEFMNDNDTVVIGLPYSEGTTYATDLEPASITMNSFSATFSVYDENEIARLSGGWLGVAVYDGYNILVNKAAVVGNNSVSVAGLKENTRYRIIVYLYADLHDGKGVYPHVLDEGTVTTTKAITESEICGTTVYDSEKDGYLGAIKVNTTLSSSTAEYLKLDILNDRGTTIYSDTNFNGTATVSEGILCGNSYQVRVYYKDIEYPEGKYIEENVWVDQLGSVWCHEFGTYSFVNDIVYYFQLNNGDMNYPAIESFTLRLYNEESARWYAEDILYILDNPTAIEDLNSQIDALRVEFNNAPYGSDEQMELYGEISILEERKAPLEQAAWYLENRADNNRDKAYWQAEKAKGKYFYELEYNGTNTDSIFKSGKSFYVVLDGALTLDLDRLQAKIDYKYDGRNGEGLVTDTASETVNLDNHFKYAYTDVRNINVSGTNMTFSLVNIDDYMLPDGGESTYEKGYVYKIVANSETESEAVLYQNNSTPSLNVDEDAWFAEYVRRIKAGESIEGLHDIYVPKYNDSYSITIDISKLNYGANQILIYTRFITEEYADGEYDDYVMYFFEKQV